MFGSLRLGCFKRNVHTRMHARRIVLSYPACHKGRGWERQETLPLSNVMSSPRKKGLTLSF